MKYTYLLIDFFTISIPFIYSFHPKLQFHRTWRAFFPAVFLVGLIFVLWDMYFTHLGVWGFNERYLTGIKLFNLPVEEVLFFFCIPYACVFTFHCLDIFFKKEGSKKMERIVTGIMIAVFVSLAIFYFERIYTSTTFFALALTLAFVSYVMKVNWLIKFYLVYAVLLIPFFIVNGLLTGTGLEEAVVWYNPEEFMGIRILTIPVEDTFYGILLILLNLLVYRRLLRTKKNTASA